MIDTDDRIEFCPICDYGELITHKQEHFNYVMYDCCNYKVTYSNSKKTN